MVYQQHNLVPRLSAAQNVLLTRFSRVPFWRALRGLFYLSETERRAAFEVLQQLDTKDRLDGPALDLSGGQQQRLCIARALATNPEVLLMDEPASALDPKATAKLEDLIYELKRDYTIVIVTHNMQQAARVSDLTAFFYEGNLIESGPTEQIYTRPAVKQTEDYITGRFG